MESESRRWPVTSEDQLLEFYDRAFAPAYRYAARLTRGDRAAAEDLTQDAFVRAVRAVRAGDVDELGVGWVLTTIRRRFIDQLRSKEREDRRLRLVSQPPAPTDPRSLRADALLGGLTERERAALIFRYVDDLPVAEVAELLGSSVRATESLLQRAKRNARRRENAS